MLPLPRNKWLLFAVMWFGAGVYALVFREQSSHAAPPFAHFDKFSHALLFFAQTWLLAKAWFSEQRRIPTRAIALFALAYALGSEMAQHFFTSTRQGDIWDVFADLSGAAAALHLAHKLQNVKTKLNKHSNN